MKQNGMTIITSELIGEDPAIQLQKLKVFVGQSSSVVRAFARGAMGRRTILHYGPTELFLVPASALAI